MAFMFPIESIINTNLNQGRHFAKDIEWTNIGEYAGWDGNIINPVYLQNNNTEKMFNWEICLAKPLLIYVFFAEIAAFIVLITLL